MRELNVIPKCKVRPVDEEKAIIRVLDNEVKRRKRAMQLSHEFIDIPHSKRRFVGDQGITDFLAEDVWQKEVFDRTGVLFEYGKMYPCVRCGYKYMAGYPPRKCIVCGQESPLQDRRFINLHQ